MRAAPWPPPLRRKARGVGKHGDVTVAVTFDGGKITDIKVVKEQENKVLARGVYTDLKDQVIATNSADLDVISGATFSSKGFLDAVKDAAKRPVSRSRGRQEGHQEGRQGSSEELFL